MYAVALLLTSATLGVDFGWEPDNKGGIEYIIQIEPESLELLKQGQPIRMQLPPNLDRVQCFRVQIGTGDIPQVMPALFEQVVNATHTANLPSGDSAPTGVPNLLLSGTENNTISVTNPVPSTPDISQALAQNLGAPKSSIPRYGSGPSSYPIKRGSNSSAATRYGDATGDTLVTPRATFPASSSTSSGSRFAPLPTASVPVGPTVSSPITPGWPPTNGWQGTTVSPELGGVSTQNTNVTTAGNSPYNRFGTPTSGQNSGVTSAPPLNRTNTYTPPSSRYQSPNAAPSVNPSYVGNTNPNNTPVNRFSTNTTNTPPNPGYTPQSQPAGQVPGYNPNQYNPISPIVTTNTVPPSPVNTQLQPVTQQTGINGNPTNAAPSYQNQYNNPNGYPAQQQPNPTLPNQPYQPQAPIYNTASQPVNPNPVIQPVYVAATNPAITPLPGQQSPTSLSDNSQSNANIPPAELTDKPWVLFVFLVAISIALNFWLGWMNLDIHTKYRELVQDVRDLKSIND